MTDSLDDLAVGTSNVKFKLADPLGRPIVGLKYEVRQTGKIVASGSSDGNGESTQFEARIGFPITIAVQRFLTPEMKVVKEVTPWCEVFPIVLVSAKVLEQTMMAEDEGAPGDYQRRTYVVVEGDTLESVALQKGVSLQELADLNEMGVDAPLSAGQIVKVPLKSDAAAAGGSSAGAPLADDASGRGSESQASANGVKDASPRGGAKGESGQIETGGDFSAPSSDAKDGATASPVSAPTDASAEASRPTADLPADPSYAPAGAPSTLTTPSPAEPQLAQTVSPQPAPASHPHSPAPALAVPHHPAATPKAPSAPAPAPTRAPAQPPAPAPAPAPSVMEIVMSPFQHAWAFMTEEYRSITGSPKAAVSLKCPGVCLKIGDKGPLVEELNIRLTGFGGTIGPQDKTKPAKPIDVFTEQTQAAVKRFQRDYMKVPESGKVCGSLLAALDKFTREFPISFDGMHCKCKLCPGFGNGYLDGAKVNRFKDKTHPRPGIEFPGMHRAIIWTLRAARFYLEAKHKELGFKYARITSGYRCWHDNVKNGRTSYNHMGNALDIQFSTLAGQRITDAQTEQIRQDIFAKSMGGHVGFTPPPTADVIVLEPGVGNFKDLAKSWVHADVAHYHPDYLNNRHYVTTAAAADGQSMGEIAKKQLLLPLLACQGLRPPAPAPAATPSASGLGRQEVKGLRISASGATFIKGWEKFKPQAYDDSEGHCTIGWGHKIADGNCASIKGTPSFEPFKNGLEQSAADGYFDRDVKVVEAIVRSAVQVPMSQNEYDALVSLVYNMGKSTSVLKKIPKLLSKLNTKDYKGCCDEFKDITNHGNEGLVKRRKAEMNIFNNNVYDSSH